MNTKTMNSPIISALEQKEKERAIHAHGIFYYRVLSELEAILPNNMEHTAETGCGRSTILFSNISNNHTVFCIDDHDYKDQSSVLYFVESEMGVKERVRWEFGPTQETLPRYKHDCQYDCVLLDGPHGYPFPDMEYYFFYPHIKPGGYLVIDDIHIPSIGRMADILQEDAMWEFVSLISTTAVLQRTEAIQTPINGDHWWTQNYNRRRISKSMEYFLDDGGIKESFFSKNARRERTKLVRGGVRLLGKIRNLFR
jgi:hypothetical protein